MKIILAFIFCMGFLFANEQENKNIVKTSELELFLFKIGFESLLKDVEVTKDKTNLNEEELKKLNTKIELIMNELYKDKRVLKSEDSSVVVENVTNNKEIENLKNEIELLKQEIKAIKKQPEQINTNQQKETLSEIKIYKVKNDLINVRDKPTLESNIVENLNKDDKVEIEYCDKYDWCKIKNEEKYISKYLLIEVL